MVTALSFIYAMWALDGRDALLPLLLVRKVEAEAQRLVVKLPLTGVRFDQYSSGNSRVVADRSASVITQSFSPALVV